MTLITNMTPIKSHQIHREGHLMTTKNLSRSWLSILGLSMTMALAGCTGMVNVPAPDTTPLQSPYSANTNNEASDAVDFTQCPSFNPKNTICTMQYDPVCVKVTTNSGISSRTAGNACSACGAPEASGYVEGEC